MSPSARLLLFGGAQLEGERGPITGRSAQRRRLALLALLAVARRGVSRDKLIGYLWEEADTDRARRLLSEAVYVLRKSLGEDAVLAAGDELRLNEAVVGCDVVAFTTALEGNDFAAATALYRGPFLDGFFVAAASEFEQWVDGERDRLARSYAGAVRHLAEEAEAAGNPDAAADWWRLLARHDPYTAAPALGLMRALDSAGDRAAALQHATSQALRLARELDAEPDPQVAAFARALRDSPPVPERIPARPAALVAEPATPDAGPSAPVAEPSTVVAEPPAIAVPEPVPDLAPTMTARAGLRRLASRRYAAFSLPILVALALGAVFISRRLPRAPPPAAPAERVGSYVAVFPFAVHGDAPQLGAAIAGLLASAMDAAGDLRTVDTHALMAAVGPERIVAVTPALAVRLADRFGATRFILGDVVESGSQVTVTAALYSANAPDERIERIVESAPGDSITALVGRLATGLLASLGDGPGYRLMRTAAHTTGSYAAFKAYYQGETEFQAGRYDRAADRFQRAVIDDPAFALAHYRLSVAAEWSFDFTLARSAARAALEASDRLTAKEALLLRAWLAFLEGRYEEAARQYARVLDTDPGNVEALAGHAEVLVHFNPVRGMAATDAEAGFARVLDLAPNYGEARFHALEFAARHRDLARYDSLFSQIDPRNGQQLAWQAVRASAWGTVADQNRVLAVLDTADELTIGIAAGRVAAQAHDFRAAGRIARLLTAPHRTREWRAGAHLLLAQLHVAGGDWAAAQRELDRAAPLERDWTVELSSLYLLHPTATASAEDLAAARVRLLAWQPGTSTPSRTFFFAAHAEIHPVLRSYLLGLLSVRQGDAQAADAHRMELLQLGRQRGPPGLVANALARSLQGHLALLNGTPADALLHLREAEIEAAPELVALSPFYSRAHDRVVIAELYQAAGDTTAAQRWYDSLIDGFDYVYAAAAHERLATLLERSDPERAEAHRREQQRLTRR